MPMNLLGGGGGGEKNAHKTFVGKIIYDQINLPTYFLINQGRWVYEGGGLERSEKIQKASIELAGGLGTVSVVLHDL